MELRPRENLFGFFRLRQPGLWASVLASMAILLTPGNSQIVQAGTAAELPYVHVLPTRVGKSGSNFRNPTIAISPQMRVSVVVESGMIGEDRRLVITHAAWTTPQMIEPSGPGDCRNPCIAYDTSGTLHLVWSEKTGEKYSIRYALFSKDGFWEDWGVLSRTPDLNCDLPRLKFDQAGRVWIAWQAGVATRHGIYHARRDTSATEFQLFDVTGGEEDRRNSNPQLFPDSLYPLVWYEEIGAQVELRAAIPDESRGVFDVIPPPDFDLLDANQQPHLFDLPTGMLGGVWTDLVGNRERVLLGLQGPVNRGEGLVADMTDTGDAGYPSVLSLGDDLIALAWVSRLPTSASVWVGSLRDGSRVMPALSLMQLADGAFTQPQLVFDGLFVHCVWISDAARGGSGDLYYCALVFRP